MTIKIPFIPKQNLSLNSDLLSSRKQNLFEALEEKNLIREASNLSIRYEHTNNKFTSIIFFCFIIFHPLLSTFLLFFNNDLHYAGKS